MDRSALVPLCGCVADVRVLCIGDVMLDRFVTGQVSRISPEAPIPVLKLTGETRMLGGAGNVVRNLAALGAETHFITVIGDDAAGTEVKALIEAEDKTTCLAETVKDRPTTIKTRFLAGGQQMLRTDEETSDSVPEDCQAKIVEMAKAQLAHAQVCILSDYAKGVLGDQALQAIIEAARDAGVPVIVDPKGANYRRYKGATMLTPNRAELAEATGLSVITDEQVEAAAAQLIDDLSLDALLATRSADGMTLVSAQRDPIHLAAEAREVFDVSGAGDTVVAALAACVAAGADLKDAAALANVAAGIVVAKVGTAVVHADDLVAALHHQDLTTAEAKVLTQEQMADRVAAWKRQGLSVGFTNGCFDLLHPGHVSLLAQARAACDRLVVGLNSDSSVKQLKGPSRPVQNEAARAAVLASLGSVDAVTLFSDETPLELISRLTPDVLVKGADYSIDQVVGRDVVEASGGKVVLADLKAGHSTTNTIARLTKDGDPA